MVVRRAGDSVWLEIAANAYLHHMVRNIVGTLLEVQREADPFGARTAHPLRRRAPRWPSGDRPGRRLVSMASANTRPFSAFLTPDGRFC